MTPISRMILALAALSIAMLTTPLRDTAAEQTDVAIAFDGSVTELGDASFTITGADGESVAFAVTADTTFSLDDGTKIALADLYVGALVIVTAREDAGAYTALAVSIVSGRSSCVSVEPSPPPTETEPPAVEETVPPDATLEVTSVPPTRDPSDTTEAKFYIEGTITELGPSSVSIDTGGDVQAVATDDATTVSHQDGSPATLGDLTVGQYVSTWGMEQDGTMTAAGIQIFDGEVVIDPDHDPCAFESVGTVVTATADRLTISEGGYLMVFAMDAETAIEQPSSDDQTPVPAGSIADLTPGAVVSIEGEYTDIGLRAARVVILDGEDHGLLLAGSIVDISADALTVDAGLAPSSFAVDANTHVVRDTGEEATLDELVPGDYVFVSSNSAADLVAAEITLVTVTYEEVYELSRADGISGVVKSIGPNGRTMVLRQRGRRTTRVTIGRTSWIANADGSHADATAIAPGMYVEIAGARGDGTTIASSVRLFNERQDVGIVRRMTAVEGGVRFVLRSPGGHRHLVTAGETTVVAFQDGRRGTLADLGDGAVVLVRGHGAHGRWQAARIVLLDGRGAMFRLDTRVESVSRQTVRLRRGDGSLKVILQSGASVLRATGRPIEPAALHTGARVLVVGYRAESGPLATMIRLLPRKVAGE